MTDDDASAPESPIEPVIEAALAFPAGIIGPTLAIVVEVLEKIAGKITAEK